MRPTKKPKLYYGFTRFSQKHGISTSKYCTAVSHFFTIIYYLTITRVS